MDSPGYHVWQHRGGTLVVEKYVGPVDVEQILANDELVIEDLPPGVDRLLFLADMSEASFESLAHERIGETFRAVDDYLSESHRIKIALYTGSNHINDFDKINAYARKGVERELSVLFFNSLSTAMTWLGLDNDERRQITRDLRGESQ